MVLDGLLGIKAAGRWESKRKEEMIAKYHRI
jgi:hypothetical protein